MSAKCASGSAAIANSDTAIDLHGIFRRLQIWTESGSADISIQLQSGAAVANAADTVKIQAGKSNGLILENVDINGFHYIGATASGRINWVASA
ncbi:MAG: hypothetical protein K2X27_13700 [Candidatus Obscuribacterales bacterium]|nr:hypothetical protein [Candidatus Obscuribacterales bacterium]